MTRFCHAIAWLWCAVCFADAFGSNPFYLENWCGRGGLKYLDDADCGKLFPGNLGDRSFVCPTVADEAPPGYFPERPLSQVTVNVTALDFLGPAVTNPHVNLAVVLVKRLASGQALYRYLSNGRHDVPAETWSSSKIFSVANAGDTLRGPLCSGGTAGPVGLDSTTTGKHGVTPLGDLITVITSYDTTLGYASNSVAKWFGDEVGGIAQLDALVHSWLHRPANESLGGSYGEAPPKDLALDFHGLSSPHCNCSLTPSQHPFVANTISPLTAVEWLRRMVLFRESSASFHPPNLLWEDIQQILYGAAPPSSLFGSSMAAGGMMVSPDLFVQAGLGTSGAGAMDKRSESQWRILSKLGAGFSTSRLVGEILTNAYACFPVLSDGKPVANAGVELLLSARASVPQDKELVQAQKALVDAVGAIVDAVVTGKIV